MSLYIPVALLILTRAFHVQGAQLSRHLDLEFKIDDKLNFSVAPTDSFLRFLSTQCSAVYSFPAWNFVQFNFGEFLILFLKFRSSKKATKFFKTMMLYKYLNLCDKSMSSKQTYFWEKIQDL